MRQRLIDEVPVTNTKSLLDRITINPDVCNGKPAIRHMRIAVENILDYLSAGETPEEILRHHPMLERDDISACLVFTNRR